MNNGFFEVSPFVEHAIQSGKPVVALESTLIAHGLPFPQNLEVASKMQKAVARSGAIPATVAVLDGVCKIGLLDHELERVAHDASSFMKVNACDISFVVGKKMNGATTVSATAWLAHLAKINVFATGGIGGVHRNYLESFDVSHDLSTLSRIPMVVVASGAKSVLDLPKTIEMLETLGVLTLGYRTDFFPAFYSASSDIRLEHRVENAQEVARIYHAKHYIGIDGSILVANPVPQEDEIPNAVMDPIINQAIREAKGQGIEGKAVTPFLLRRVKELSQGTSMKANISLLIENAKVAGEIAYAISESIRNEQFPKVGF